MRLHTHTPWHNMHVQQRALVSRLMCASSPASSSAAPHRCGDSGGWCAEPCRRRVRQDCFDNWPSIRDTRAYTIPIHIVQHARQSRRRHRVFRCVRVSVFIQCPWHDHHHHAIASHRKVFEMRNAPSRRPSLLLKLCK